MNLSGVDPAWFWLAGAAILAATELALPGVFLVWLAGAALLTAIVVLATGISLPAQFALFGLAAVAMVLLGRQAYARQSHSSSDPLLNDRAARLMGRVVVVSEAISQGSGRVVVGDGIWNARGTDAPAGQRVRIVSVENGCLLVEPVEASPRGVLE